MQSSTSKLDTITGLLAKRRDILIILSLFIAALIIRLIGIDWGLPGQNFPHSQFVSDETVELFGTLLLGKGVYQVSVIKYQPFFYFAAYPFFAFYFLVGFLTGRFSDWTDFINRLDGDISGFFVPGRIMIALVGALTVCLLYHVGSKLIDRRVGFLSAIFLMFSFGHIIFSKIFRLDSLLPFVLLVSTYSVIRLGWAKPEKIRPFVFAGLATAAAATTKITGLSALIPLLVFPLIEGVRFPRFPFVQPKWDKRWPFALTVFAGTFFALILPYLLFSSGGNDTGSSVEETVSAAAGVTRGLANRFSTASVLSDTYALSPFRWSLPWHLSSTLPRQLGWPIYILCLLGILLMLFDREHRRQIAYLLVAMVAFIVPIGLLKRSPWRDMVPILPLLCLAAGYGLIRIFDFARTHLGFMQDKRTSAWALGLVTLAIIVLPLVNIYKHTRLLSYPDTRYLARDWIEANIPAGSRLGHEKFGPPILNEQYRNSSLGELEQNESDSSNSRPTYAIFGMSKEVGGVRPPEEVLPFIIENEIDYVVVNSVFYGRFYNGALDTHAPEFAESGRQMHDVIASHLIPVAQFVPNWRDSPGPVIQIFSVPDDLAAEPEFEPGAFVPYLGMDRPASSVGYYQYAPR